MSLQGPRHVPLSLSPSRLLRKLVAAGVWLLVAGWASSEPESTPLDSLARLHGPASWDVRSPHSLRLVGTVTGLDPERRLVVLQDGSEAVGFYLAEFPLDLALGEQVQLEAEEALPYLFQLPRHPWYPDEVIVSPRVTAPPDSPGQHLARLRAFLVPPKTGEYQFWLSSDDGGELWLSEDERPERSQMIAQVNGWTRPGEWDKYASQQSTRLPLVAGKRYYLETEYEQRGGQSHLDLAWAGPGWERQPVPGAVLQPWPTAPASGPTPPAGVTMEVWRGDFADGVWWLGHHRYFQGELMVRGTRWTKLGRGSEWPEVELKAGQPLERDQRYRRASVTGVVSFVGQGRNGSELELRDGNELVRVRFSTKPARSLAHLKGQKLRVHGVSVPAVNGSVDTVFTDFLALDEKKIDVLDSPWPTDSSRKLSLRQIQKEPLGQDKEEVIRAAGKITEVLDASTLWVEDRGSFQAAFSKDGGVWETFGPELDIDLGERSYAGLGINANSDVLETSAHFQVPSEWPGLELTAIGRATRPGLLERNGASVHLRGSGSQIWNLSDQFHFAGFPSTGGQKLEAQLLDFAAEDADAKTGLLFRESLEANAEFVSLIYSRNTGVAMQWRQNDQGIVFRSFSGGWMSPPLNLRLERRINRLLVRLRQAGDWAAGQEIELQGHRLREDGQITLVEAEARPHNPESTSLFGGRNWPLLSIKAVQSEAFSERRFDYFKVRGQITFSGEFRGKKMLSLQDDTSGIWVGTQILDTKRLPPAGTLVEMQSTPGWRGQSFKTLTADNLLILGAAKLPAPIQHPLEYALPLRGAGTWTETAGIVRSVSADGLLKIKAEGEEFFAHVEGGDRGVMNTWVDRSLRLRGTVGYLNERELIFFVPGQEQVELTDSPPGIDPAAPQPIDAFDPTQLINRNSHRVVLAGIVVYAAASATIIHDGRGSATLQLAGKGTSRLPALGSRLTVQGFPEVVGQRLTLAESSVLREEAPAAEAGAAPFVHAPEYAVAEVSGEVLAGEKQGSLTLVKLAAGDETVLALWDDQNGDPPKWPEGSTVQLRGLKVSTTSPVLNPEFLRTPRTAAAFALLLRSSADILAVRKPGWWVLTRTLLATGALGVLAGLAAWQMHRLRRRVALRTAQLAEAMGQLQKETQSRATLAERNRLAGEIHDSMEQGLSALLLQLESILKNGTCPAPVRNQLEMMRNMVTYSRAEVKHAVWDLQTPWLENSNLPGAILHMIEQLALEPNRIQFSTTGEFSPLPPRTEHHLLRITQEAITNALKHAEATLVEVTLSYGSDTVRLTVTDNGKGFQTATPPPSEAGRFGLRSLSGRARKIDAALSVQSSPGQGTTLTVQLARPPSYPSP